MLLQGAFYRFGQLEFAAPFLLYQFALAPVIAAGGDFYFAQTVCAAALYSDRRVVRRVALNAAVAQLLFKQNLDCSADLSLQKFMPNFACRRDHLAASALFFGVFNDIRELRRPRACPA